MRLRYSLPLEDLNNTGLVGEVLHEISDIWLDYVGQHVDFFTDEDLL